MKCESYTRSINIPVPPARVFDWHSRPGALERLTPPWERIEVLEKAGSITDGSRTVLRARMGPLSTKWVAEHVGYVEGVQFKDVQISGPFARWEHTHRVDPAGEASCVLTDHIEYQLPFGLLGGLCGGAIARKRLDRLFQYRHAVTREDNMLHARLGYGLKSPGLRILVTGTSGLIGSALVPFLTTAGHEVVRLVRRAPKPGEIYWNPDAGEIDEAGLEGFDAVIHLAGKNIAAQRWTAVQKVGIRESRVGATSLLARAIANLTHPPKVVLGASAIGYYGNRPEQLLQEGDGPGQGFLASVCRDWEAALDPVREKGVRTVPLRIGAVLSISGGALRKMLLPFRLGGGGVLGHGAQYMSCIGMQDVLGAILHVLSTDSLDGPVNVVGPESITNRTFTRTLGEVLGRPTLVPMPAGAARLAFGELADELLLSSTRVEPKRLSESGYVFRHPTLSEMLWDGLGYVRPVDAHAG